MVGKLEVGELALGKISWYLPKHTILSQKSLDRGTRVKDLRHHSD